MRWVAYVARMEEGRGVYRILWGNLGESIHLGDPDLDGKITRRLIFSKWNVGVWTGSSRLRIGTGGGHL